MQQSLVSSRRAFLFGTAILTGLSLASLHSYLLFHSLAEVFSIVVAFTIFTLTWHSRRFIDNNYLLFLGISFAFVGGLDLLHLLAYKGMGVFPGYDANLPTQLWIACRYTGALSFAAAAFFITNKVNIAKSLAVYSLVTFFLLTAIFLGKFPDCYIEGSGLTDFKKVSEYLISLIFVFSLILLYRNRTAFDRNVFQLLNWTILISVAAELAFARYVSVYGFFNLAGHLLYVLSFYMIYRAIIVTGIERPYGLVFRNLKQREEELFRAGNDLKRELSERAGIQNSLSESLVRVEEEKNKTRAILAALGDAVSIQSTDFRVLYQNQIHKDLTGDHAGEHCYEAYALKDDVCEGCPVALSFSDGNIHRHEKSNITERGLVHIDITASPLRDSTGRIIAGIEIVRDITERRKAEEKLRLFSEAVSEAMDGIQITDLAGNVMYSNNAVEEIYGFKAGELLGRHVSEMNADKEFADRVILPSIRKKGRWSGEVVVVHKEGRKFPIWLSTSMVKNEKGEPIAMIGIIRDITERKTAEEKQETLLAQLHFQAEELRRHRDHLEELVGQRTAELRKLNDELETELTERRAVEERLRSSKQQLRNLSAHLHAVREEERTSIAREIHDELGQALTALKMDVSWLGNKYRAHEPLSGKTKSMIKLVDSTIRTVKKISSELRPVVLDDLGLAAAIEWQAEEFQKRSGIECEVNFTRDDIFLHRAISTAIFRIFQEALTNVMRHSAATKVRVCLEEKDGAILLSVEDNGKGISETQMNDPKSFGLIGIRERVHFLGGEVKIAGARGKGTSITLRIPSQNNLVIP